MKINEHNLGNYYVPNETYKGNCLDIGCNVGGFIKKYSDHFKRIDYYEPIKQCFDICQDYSKNHEHITGYNLAGWSESGKELNILEHKNEESGSSAIESEILNSEWSDKKVIQTVKTISLEDMLSKFDEEVDYCKCDCETSEYFIFLNKDLSKIKYLGIELHWQIGKERQEELLKYILKTHKLVMGSLPYSFAYNREVLLKRK